MAFRTDVDAVSAIIEVDASIDVTPFIEAANALVTEVCGSVATYDAVRLELIERWLSAHFYAVRDPRANYEAAGPVSQRLEGMVALNLSVTRYGQQAMILDTAGGLARLNRTIDKGGIGRKVSVTWLGTDPDPDEVS